MTDRLPAVIGNVPIQQNFDALRADRDASRVLIDGGLGVWRTIIDCAHGGTSWGSSFLGDSGLNGWQLAAAGTVNLYRVFTLDDADFAIAGYVTQVRSVSTFSCNPTAPGINFSTGLCTITTVGGGAGTISWSGAGFVSNAALTAPGASAFSTAKGPAVTMPSGVNQYVLGTTPSGAAAANHRGVLAILAQMRHIPA